MLILSCVEREMRQAEKEIELQEKDKDIAFCRSVVLSCAWFVKIGTVINASVMCWTWIC